MDRENPAADISSGSAWEDQNSARVVVLDTAAGYVRFADYWHVNSVAHHFAFRARYRPMFDRVQVRSQFNTSCANLGEFRVYWNPTRRKIIARSVVCSRAFALPPGVMLVGVYCAPFDPEEFLTDLDCLIETHERQSRLVVGV